MSLERSKKGEKGHHRNDPAHVRVHLRLKGNEDKHSARYNIFANGTQLHVPNNEGRLELDKWYRFDHIYSPLSANKEIYRVSAYDLVESSLNGFNTAMIAYGQTGSGKTRTLMSKDGVTAHIVSHMFNRVWKDANRDYKVSLSYLQIYNEQIHDLLNPHGKLECAIREDPKHGLYVENLTKVLCETPMDAYALINIGRRSLVLGESKMNRLTNRSHTICQISIDKSKKEPRMKKRSMQETYTLSDVLAAQEEDHKIDFTTVPFNKENLKKRHSIAVAKVNRRKSLKKEMVHSPTPPKSPLLHVPHIRLEKRNSLRDELLPSHLGRRGSGKRSSSSGSFSEGVKKRASMPNGRKEEDKITMADSIGIENVKRLQEIYHSSLDSDMDTSHEERKMDARSKLAFKSFPSISSDLSFSEGSLIDNDSQYGTSDFLEGESVGSEDSNYLFEGYRSANGVNGGENIVMRGKISIVDLAGSERLKTSFSDDEDKLKEARNINLSLLELGNVISALTDNKQKHVPFRNSVLTRLLQDSLGGNCKTTFLLCASTKLADANEAKSTFEFGQKLKRVLTRPVLNLDVDYRKKYDELSEDIKRKEVEYSNVVQEYRELQASTEEQVSEQKRRLEDQEFLMNSVQKEFDKVVCEFMEANSKVGTLEGRLSASQSLVEAKDEEILRLLKELDSARISQKDDEKREIIEAEKLNVACKTSMEVVRPPSSAEGVLKNGGETSSSDMVDGCNHPDEGEPQIGTDVYIKGEGVASNVKSTDKCDAACNTAVERPASTPPSPIVVTFLQPRHQKLRSVSDFDSKSMKSDVCTNTECDYATATLLSNRYSSTWTFGSIDDILSKEGGSQSQIHQILQYESVEKLKAVVIAELSALKKLSNHLEYPTYHTIEQLYGERPMLATRDISMDSVKSFAGTQPDMGLLIKEIFDESQPSEKRFSMLDEELKKQFQTLCHENSFSNNTPRIRVEDRAFVLQNTLWKYKKAMDEELLQVACEVLNYEDLSVGIDVSSESKMYESLARRLSDENAQLNMTPLRRMLEVVLSDHALTVFLMVLLRKKKEMLEKIDDVDTSNDVDASNDVDTSKDADTSKDEHETSIDGVEETAQRSQSAIPSNVSTDELPRKARSVTDVVGNGGVIYKCEEPIESDTEYDRKPPKKKGLGKLFCMPSRSKSVKKRSKNSEKKVHTVV